MAVCDLMPWGKTTCGKVTKLVKHIGEGLVLFFLPGLLVGVNGSGWISGRSAVSYKPDSETWNSDVSFKRDENHPNGSIRKLASSPLEFNKAQGA